MKRLALVILLVLAMTLPVSALEFTAPEAPDDVRDLMPIEKDRFADGLWSIISSAVAKIHPDIADAAKSCVRIFGIVLLVSVLRQIPSSQNFAVELAGILAVSLLLLGNTKSLIRLGTDTVNELSEYGKLLLPVLTAALAAQGGSATSAALYTATAAFNAVLTTFIGSVLVPMVYMYLLMSVADAATGIQTLQKIRDLIKWFMNWCLKTVLYIYTGYISITGVVSGSVDAAAMKAAKLTISGMVPVVGGILSDASEAVLVGAGVMKNAVGIYGLFAIAAILISPFLRLGIHYLLLKLTAAICEAFDVKKISGVIKSFSGAMGVVLGMTGAISFLQLMSIVCLMRGIS